jgi:cysteinyl-tRNA synthetase
MYNYEMLLYDTGDKNVKKIPSPIEKPCLTFYACGPTVYDNTHIGHMRRYVMDDVLKRTLIFLGYKVAHVINITDVGHLTGDDDSGEDKLERGALQKGKTVWDVAQEYEDQFWKTMSALNINKKEIIILNATKNVKEMIKMIEILEDKGYTYETKEAVYFDTSKFKQYGALSGQNLTDKRQGAREDVKIDKDKRHPADFSLWFKRVGRFANHTMHWESPWGTGFPGWHIECSAMAMKGLSTETIDIHSGGIDHIPVHHENEIAQSEAFSGKKFVNWWVHHAFLQVDGEKMSKSKKNFYTLNDVLQKNIDPLTLRYFFLQANYRKPMNFTWAAVEATSKSYRELVEFYHSLQKSNKKITSENLSGGAHFFIKSFTEKLENDLNTAGALAEIFYMIKSKDISDSEKKYLLELFDSVLGLKFTDSEKVSVKIPTKILVLAEKRLAARKNKDFGLSDDLRNEILKLGFTIEDKEEGYEIKKI